MIHDRSGRLVALSAVVGMTFVGLPGYSIAPIDVQWWNDKGDRQFCNNCYNYATNYPNGSNAQPGWAGGGASAAQALECDALVAAAESDGLLFAGAALSDSTCDPGCSRVALVSSGFDFHWYREEVDGMWSHKPGQSEATRFDNSAQPITDPSKANRNGGHPFLNYTEFCGFLCVCRERLLPLEGGKPGKPITCGDGVADVDQGEDCDGLDFAGKSCLDLGFEGGGLACTSACEFDTSECRDSQDCADVSGSWQSATSFGYLPLLVLDQDGCALFGTLHTEDSCPGVCSFPSSRVSGNVEGDTVRLVIHDDPYVSCNTCEIECTSDDDAELTFHGGEMSGDVITYCPDGADAVFVRFQRAE